MKLLMNVSKSLLSWYKIDLETSMRGSDFFFDSVQLLNYNCHKINFKCGWSYIASPKWIKKKQETINPKNEDDKCFQYATIITLTFEEINKDPLRVSNIKPFINYNWKGINYPSEIEYWKRFEKNNLTVALNILYVKEKEICPAYVSKINLNYEKQIIL